MAIEPRVALRSRASTHRASGYCAQQLRRTLHIERRCVPRPGRAQALDTIREYTSRARSPADQRARHLNVFKPLVSIFIVENLIPIVENRPLINLFVENTIARRRRKSSM
jgi:hypothetical protein